MHIHAHAHTGLSAISVAMVASAAKGLLTKMCATNVSNSCLCERWCVCECLGATDVSNTFLCACKCWCGCKCLGSGGWVGGDNDIRNKLSCLGVVLMGRG
jgi:hypothetical protein